MSGVIDSFQLMGRDWTRRLWSALENHSGGITRPYDLLGTICELWADMRHRERLGATAFYHHACTAGLADFDPCAAPVDSRAWFHACESEDPPEHLFAR